MSMKRVAIVTGASRGIGKTVAERLAKDGFVVAVNYVSGVAEAAKTVSEIKVRGGDAVPIKADVSEARQVEELFAQTIKTYGSADVVVQNAGIMSLSPIADGDAAGFDRVTRVNLRGTFLVLAQAARRIANGGRIVALSSSVLAKSFPTFGLYIASKAGVEGLVHVLANELRGRDVTVNAVAPGPVATDLLLKNRTDEEITQLANMSPLERLGQPQQQLLQPRHPARLLCQARPSPTLRAGCCWRR